MRLALVLLLAPGACAPAPTATPQPTAAAAATPAVHVTLKSTITDKATGLPVKATVKQDGVVMFKDVSYFELVLPADLRGRPVSVRVEAPGYQPWEQAYEHYWKTSKVYEFPVRLERE